MVERRQSEDWVRLLEHVYAMDDDDTSWLSRVLARTSAGFWKGGASTAFTFSLINGHVTPTALAIDGPEERHDQIRKVLQDASEEAINEILLSGKTVRTLSEAARIVPKHMKLIQDVSSIAEILAVISLSGSGRGMILNFELDNPRDSTREERRRWTLGAAHIGAALRLRDEAARMADFNGSAIEAVFDGGGKLYEAREAAENRDTRTILREAVRRIDRLRTASGRQDQDAALRNWEALVQGRWSIVDKFDTDGRRFVVAVRNDPRFPDPRGLSLQERQVAEFIGLGKSAKEIAYTLGIAAASAENSARRAQRKLGLQSRVELAAFFSPLGLRARLAEVVIANGAMLVGGYPHPAVLQTDDLTASEKAVLEFLVTGCSNEDIAQRRQTSVRTVANQIQSIFRKYQVRSRTELISQLARSYLPDKPAR